MGNNQKQNSIRSSLVSGNSKSLWNTVNLAKDTNPNIIPKLIKHNGVELKNTDLSDTFAKCLQI